MAVVYLGNSMQRVFVVPAAVAKDGAVKGAITVNPGQVVEVDKELVELNKKNSKAFMSLVDGNHIIIESKPFNINNRTLFNPLPKGAPIQLSVDKKVQSKGVTNISIERVSSNEAPAGKQGGA